MNSLNPWLELMVETLLLPSLRVPELRGGNYILPVTGRCLLLGLGEGTGGYLCQVAGGRGMVKAWRPGERNGLSMRALNVSVKPETL